MGLIRDFLKVYPLRIKFGKLEIVPESRAEKSSPFQNILHKISLSGKVTLHTKKEKVALRIKAKFIWKTGNRSGESHQNMAQQMYIQSQIPQFSISPICMKT